MNFTFDAEAMAMIDDDGILHAKYVDGYVHSICPDGFRVSTTPECGLRPVTMDDLPMLILVYGPDVVCLLIDE